MTDQDRPEGSPVPARVFDEVRVPELVGGSSPAVRCTVGGADVVVGPAGMVVVTAPHDDAGRSGVWSAEEVRLVGPAPAAVSAWLQGAPWEEGGRLPPVHVAVRVEGGVLELGTARLAELSTSDGVLLDCVLLLDTPLSRGLLDRVRPPLPPGALPDLDWLREVNGDRAAALEAFLTGWYPPAGDDERPGLDASPHLPRALSRLYGIAARRPGVLGVQNRLLPEPETVSDRLGESLVLGVENQGGFVWALRGTKEEPGSDPTVWFRVGDGEPVAEEEPLSGFLIQFSLYEAALGADYVALPLPLTAAEVDRFTRGLTPVPLRPFRPDARMRFYVAPGLVVWVMGGEGPEFDVWAGAGHRSALRRLADLPVAWVRFDG